MVQKTKSKKGLKKSFYEVEAPMTAVKIHLYGGGIEDFDGRIIKIDLTKSLRGKSLELKMKIKKEKEKLKANAISLNLVSSYIRRNIRRGSDYIEDSLIVKCRDTTAKIKPLLITRMRVSRSVRKALRVAAKKHIESYVKIRDKKELFSDIMTNKLQKSLSTKLKKIYPLALSEIRAFEILNEDLDLIVDNVKKAKGEKEKELINKNENKKEDIEIII